MKMGDVRIALDNYFCNLLDQNIIDKMPDSLELDNLFVKVYRALDESIYIDQNWLLYDSNMKLMYDNAGSLTNFLSQGFVNEVNEFIKSLKEIYV
jgi:hypothetical protein